MHCFFLQGYFFDIGKYGDAIAMKHFIDTLLAPFFNETYVDSAMIAARKMLRKSKRYSDNMVGKAVLLITDGIPTDKKAAANAVCIF